MLNSIKNKISNITKSDKYGESVHFISFYGAILSRLAYMNDTTFLENYCKIFNNGDTVIDTNILTIINNNVGSDNIFKKTDLDITKIITDDKTTQNEIMKKVDTEQFAKKINIINGETLDTNAFLDGIGITKNDSKRVKYISIATSNYSEIYVLTDEKMPNVVLVLFRGTYSAKSAQSYTKASSMKPLTIKIDNTTSEDKFMFGIYKITLEVMNTIIESIRYLTKDKKDVKVITTGHSLGGAMATIFSYEWVKLAKGKRPNNVSDKITCISLGAPRVFGKETSDKFCDYSSGDKKIFYLRIITRGDPVPALPPKQFGYSHPCSTKGKEDHKKLIYESCNTSYTTTMAINYDADLDCQNFERRTYVTNPFSHTNYLQIKYLSAVDISAFIKSGTSFKTTEIARNESNKNATVVRLIYFDGEEFKNSFFDLNKARGQDIDDKALENKVSSETQVAVQVSEEENDEQSQQTGGLFWNSSKPKNTTQPTQSTTQPQPNTQSTTQPQPTTQSTTQPQPTTQSTTQQQSNTQSQSTTQQPIKPQTTMDKIKSTANNLTTFTVSPDKNINSEIFEKIIDDMKPIQTIPTIAKLPLKGTDIFTDFPSQSGGYTRIKKTKNKKTKRMRKMNRQTKRKILNKRRTNKRRKINKHK